MVGILLGIPVVLVAIGRQKERSNYVIVRGLLVSAVGIEPTTY
jgi:hypothetical protein